MRSSTSGQTPLSNSLSHYCNQTDDTWYDFLSRYNLARKCPINRLYKHAGTSLRQRFGSNQSNGFGSTSTGDLKVRRIGVSESVNRCRVNVKGSGDVGNGFAFQNQADVPTVPDLCSVFEGVRIALLFSGQLLFLHLFALGSGLAQTPLCRRKSS